MSRDGLHVFFDTTETVAGLDGDGMTDVYEHFGGSTALVSAPAGDRPDGAPYPAAFAGVSADGGHAFFTTQERMTAADPEASWDVYDRSAGTTTLVSAPGAGAYGDYPFGAPAASFVAASSDGSRVFFETSETLVGEDTDGWDDVYERFGGTTRLVSGPGAGATGDAWPADFAAITSDGSHLFFLTKERMVGDDSDSLQDVFVSFDTTAVGQRIGDFDGDGDTDVGVFRPSVGGWYIDGQSTVFFGLDGDIPVPGDYDGNGTTDIAIFRPSVGGWYVLGQVPTFHGLATDVPVPGDYDGNGTTDVAVFRGDSGAWLIAGQTTVYLGLSTDMPVPGDYDGNGTTEPAVYRPDVGAWFITGQPTIFHGLNGDIPTPQRPRVN
jgi:hypothetical protein